MEENNEVNEKRDFIIDFTKNVTAKHEALNALLFKLIFVYKIKLDMTCYQIESTVGVGEG